MKLTQRELAFLIKAVAYTIYAADDDAPFSMAHLELHEKDYDRFEKICRKLEEEESFF